MKFREMPLRLKNVTWGENRLESDVSLADHHDYRKGPISQSRTSLQLAVNIMHESYLMENYFRPSQDNIHNLHHISLY